MPQRLLLTFDHLLLIDECSLGGVVEQDHATRNTFDLTVLVADEILRETDATYFTAAYRKSLSDVDGPIVCATIVHNHPRTHGVVDVSKAGLEGVLMSELMHNY